MPAVWAQHLPSGLTREEVHVDGSAGKEIAPAAPQRQVKKALASKPADSSAKSFISKPFNFQHKFHVKMDQRASTGFTVSQMARHCNPYWRGVWCLCSLPLLSTMLGTASKMEDDAQDVWHI